MILDKFRLDGAVALVTGPGSGIGAAVAEALAQAGADIVGAHRSSVDATQAAVTNTGRRFHSVPADMSRLDASGCAEIVDAAVDAAGCVDILVNNAGTIIRAAALDVVEADWQSVLRTNLSATFLLSQAVGRHFASRPADERPSRGKIINIASMLSFQGGVNVAAYAASKSGIAGLTKALANEWASLSINVNAIAPGYIATRATHALRADKSRSAAILDRIPAGRWGRPADLAGAAVFLASAASDYMHGAVVPVDGGWLAR